MSLGRSMRKTRVYTCCPGAAKTSPSSWSVRVHRPPAIMEPVLEPETTLGSSSDCHSAFSTPM